MSDRVLVLGASASVGAALLKGLALGHAEVIPWSRKQNSAKEPGAALLWQRGDLFRDSLPDVEKILSAGPLDGLLAALSRSPACRPRVIVALSSSSAHFKRESNDFGERALAARLAASEAGLGKICLERDVRCVILRPTLIYGGDDAAHFGAVVTQAQRFGFLALPDSARGLRMPIHAADLAATMLAALDTRPAAGTFDVGGGETLTYGAMLERVLRARRPGTRSVRIPDSLFRSLLSAAHRIGLLHGLTQAVVLRMREDLVVDDTPARHAIGHAPGAFRP
ncbi:MAG: nucleoside-diphosphate sugar epimerase [Lysobacterales bacterium]